MPSRSVPSRASPDLIAPALSLLSPHRLTPSGRAQPALPRLIRSCPSIRCAPRLPTPALPTASTDRCGPSHASPPSPALPRQIWPRPRPSSPASPSPARQTSPRLPSHSTPRQFSPCHAGACRDFRACLCLALPHHRSRRHASPSRACLALALSGRCTLPAAPRLACLPHTGRSSFSKRTPGGAWAASFTLPACLVSSLTMAASAASLIAGCLAKCLSAFCSSKTTAFQ